MTRRKSAETAILVASDWHYGKLTSSYNPGVAADRLTALAKRMSAIRDIETAGRSFDRLIVLWLGDTVDGAEIYPAHMAYVAEPNVEAQAERGSDVLASWLTGLARTWGRVTFVPIPGNHGRAGKFAHLAANWDTVCHRYVKAKATSGAVTVDVETEGSVPFVRMYDIRGLRWLLHHGH